jgi:class 3 adenylate cyclase
VDERILYLPGWLFSPAGYEQLPACKAALDSLRSALPVDVFSWPWVEGAEPAEPTWEGTVSAIRKAASPGCHLVASGPASVPAALMSLDRNAGGVRSFIASGMSPPVATLRALGMDTLADVAEAPQVNIDTRPQAGRAGRARTSYQFVRLIAMGASEEEIRREQQLFAAQRLDDNHVAATTRSFDELDMVELAPLVTVPSLYLEYPTQMAQWSGMAEVFLRFAPGAEVDELASWGQAMHDSESGKEFAAKCLGFIGMVRNRTKLTTILVTDVVDSTARAFELGNLRWTQLLEQHHSVVRKELERHRGHEVDTAGDGFLATFDSPAQAVRCALALQKAVRDLSLDVRAGIHSGECEMVGEKVGGLAVNLAARVAAQASGGEVIVSEPVRQLLAGSGFSFEERGEHELKGVPGTWRLFAVVT